MQEGCAGRKEGRNDMKERRQEGYEGRACRQGMKEGCEGREGMTDTKRKEGIDGRMEAKGGKSRK
jgi:hypothetical protein